MLDGAKTKIWAREWPMMANGWVEEIFKIIYYEDCGIYRIWERRDPRLEWWWSDEIESNELLLKVFFTVQFHCIGWISTYFLDLIHRMSWKVAPFWKNGVLEKHQRVKPKKIDEFLISKTSKWCKSINHTIFLRFFGFFLPKLELEGYWRAVYKKWANI